MSVGPVLLALVALLLVAANLAYSLLALACHRLRERRYPARLPLGIPLLGSVLAVGAGVWMVAEGGPGWAAWLVLADSGGPLGWAVALVWRRAGQPRRRSKSSSALHALREDRAGGVR